MNRPLYLILGPSGSGKTTIVRRVCEMMRVKSVHPFTTRPHRVGERSDYTHVSDEFFDQIIEIGDIVVVYTEFDGYRYCADRDMVDDADLYIIDPAGVDMLKRADLGRPIYEVCVWADKDIRCKRIVARGESEEDAQRRIEHDDEVFEVYADALFNDLYGVYEINTGKGICGPNLPAISLANRIMEHWPEEIE